MRRERLTIVECFTGPFDRAQRLPDAGVARVLPGLALLGIENFCEAVAYIAPQTDGCDRLDRTPQSVALVFGQRCDAHILEVCKSELRRLRRQRHPHCRLTQIR